MAEALVDKMTVDEMIGQLKFDAPAIERLHVPAYNWWNEGLHGVARAGTATVFPQAIGMAAAWNPEMMKEVGNAISDEARAKYNESIKHEDRDIYKGLTLWSPNVNIFRDPRWGRGHETYGEDPFLRPGWQWHLLKECRYGVLSENSGLRKAFCCPLRTGSITSFI